MVRVLSSMVSIKVVTRALATRRVVKGVYAAEGSERKGGKRSDISILLALSGRSFTCVGHRGGAVLDCWTIFCFRLHNTTTTTTTTTQSAQFRR